VCLNHGLSVENADKEKTSGGVYSLHVTPFLSVGIVVPGFLIKYMTEKEKEIIESAKNFADAFKMDYTKLDNPEMIYNTHVRSYPLSGAVIECLINLYLTVLKEKK